MAKKPRKTAAKAASQKPAGPAKSAATKRPPAALTDGHAARIADALEAIATHLSANAPAGSSADSLNSADAFVWHPDGRLSPVPKVSRVAIGLLKGIDRMRDILIENTERFANGLPANNALLWGARGMGKSSLVKASHASINHGRKAADRLKLIEIHREDIESRPENVILYATSNRRHLLSREMIENERSTAINPGEAVEEKVSLSDRFGLWLGFHRCSQDEYLAMVRGYCGHFGIKLGEEELEREALEWSTTRGSRSGRVAWQFTQELAGRLGVRLTGK